MKMISYGERSKEETSHTVANIGVKILLLPTYKHQKSQQLKEFLFP